MKNRVITFSVIFILGFLIGFITGFSLLESHQLIVSFSLSVILMLLFSVIDSLVETKLTHELIQESNRG